MEDKPLHFKATIDDSGVTRSIEVLKRKIQGLGDSTESESERMQSSFTRLEKVIIGFFSVQKATQFIQSMVRVRGEFQQLEVAFTTMLRSKEKSDKLMGELIKFAAETPFGLKDTATAAKQLLAYGSSADSVTEELRMLGDVSAGVSARIGDIVYLYGTLRTQGRAYAVDIRQFANRGIPIYAELAKVLKINEDRVMDFVSAGKVGFSDVEKAFKNMASATGMFGGLMEAQSKTLTGQLEKLSDAWDVMLNNMGTATEGMVGDAIEGVADLIENYERVLEIVGVLVGSYGAYRAALIATSVHQALISANTVGYVVELDKESVAKIANANATANMMRVEVSSLAAKKAAATQAAVNAAATLKEAQAKLSSVASERSIAAVEAASLARKKALAISSDFYAKKTLIETAAKNGNSSASIANLRAELSNLAVKKSAAIQAATLAAANVRATESKAVQAASERVIAAQEKASITRKAALSASQEFHTKRVQLETISKQANAAATVQLTGVEALNAAGKRILTKVTAAYNAVLAASPVAALTALIAALGVVTYSLIQSTTASEESQKRLNKVQEEGALTAEKETLRVKGLVKIIQDHKKSNEDRKKAYDELKSSTDKAIDNLSLEEVAAGDAAIALNEYTESIKKAREEAVAFAEYNGLQDQLAELEVKGIKAVSVFDKLATSLANTFRWTKEAREISLGDWWAGLFDGNVANQQIVNSQLKKKYAEIADLRKGYGDSIDKKLASGGKDDEEVKKTTEINKELLKLQKAFLKQLDKAEQEAYFSTLSKNDREIAENKAKYEQMRKDAEKAGLGGAVFTRIDKMELQTTGNIQYEQETELYFKNLEKRKAAYIAYEELKKNTSKEYADERFNYEYDSYKTLIDELKSEEERLRDLASTRPEGLTRPESDKLIKIIKEREDLADHIKKIENDLFAYVYNKTLTNEEKIAAIKEKYTKEDAALRKKYSGEELEIKLSINTENASKEFQGVFESYLNEQKKYEDLGSMIAGATKNQIRAQIQSLQNYITSATDLTEDQVKQLQAMIISLQRSLPQATNDGLDGGIVSQGNTRLNDLANESEAVQANIKRLTDQINSLRNKDGVIPPEAAKKVAELNAEINGLKARLADLQSSFQSFGALAEIFGDIGNGVIELANDLGGLNEGLANTLNVIGEIANIGSSGLGGIANILKGIEGIKDLGKGEGGLLGGIKGLFSKDAEGGGGLLGGLSGVASLVGPIGKGVALVGKAVGGVVNHFKKLKEEAIRVKKEIADYYEAAKRGELEYQNLLRNRDRDNVKRGKTTYQGIVAELDLLKKQSPELKKAYDQVFAALQNSDFVSGKGYKHGTWFRKAKTWDIMSSLAGSDYAELEKLYTQGKLKDKSKEDFETLKKFREELEAAGVDVQELQSQLNEMLTGTSVEGLSNAFADLFASGKNAAKDFGKSFEDILKNAIVNGFKYKYLEKAVEPLNDMLIKAMEDGVMTGSEANALKDLAQTKANEAQAYWDTITSALDIDFANKESESPSRDAINRITETQADVITGTLKGMQISAIEGNHLTRIQTDAMVKGMQQQHGVATFDQTIS